jgi:hypothetical protein
VGRGSTFTVHGHIWQRDPYVCPGENQDNLTGKCLNVSMDDFADVGSRRIGDNPIGMWLGGQESVQPYQHFEARLEHAGGAANAGDPPIVTGDFLWRDQASFGNTDGIWGILRVAAAPPPAPVVTIVAPPDGSVFEEDQEITFQGTAFDSDGNPISNNIEWISSIDGELYVGNSFTTTLSLGTHIITASATAANVTGSDSITVTITSAGDTVDVTRADYRVRQDRWNIQGMVSPTSSSVDVYLNSVVQENLIGAAIVDAATGDWSFNGTGAVGASEGGTVIAVSSGGAVSDPPFPVSVR